MLKDQTIAQLLSSPLQKPKSFIFSSEIDILCAESLVKKVKAFLYQECILLTYEINKSVCYYKIQLNFDLKFEVFSSINSNNRKQGDLNKYYSIKFIKNQNFLEFTNFRSDTDLLLWRQHLIKSINQANFHQIFKPVKELGQGNFATVYEAVSRVDNRSVAIKAFNKKAIYQKDFGQKGLLNEIKIMRQLNHKNLMKMYGVYESKNSIYLCFELLTGGDLFDRIKQKRKFSLTEAKTIMKSILEGLIQIHSHNIMHRDLKPENILFRSTDTNQCVLADFGLAQHSNKEELLFVKCGTPGYAAPQILNLKENSVKYNEACDMFSLGVIFHLLILGKSPFPGRSIAQILIQNKICRFNFQDSIYKQLQPKCLKLLKSLLERNPKKRITAASAINHQFFIGELSEQKIKQKIEPIEVSKSIERVSSPIDLFNKINKDDCLEPEALQRNISRKRKIVRIQQNCLEFKMNAHILESQDIQGKQNTSPIFCKPFGPRMNDHHFKKIALQNS